MSEIDLNAAVRKNTQSRLKLSALLERITNEARPAQSSQAMDVIITPTEVNGKHGTGVLIDRLFADSADILSIRSRNVYDGEQQFGAIEMCLSHPEGSRLQAFYNVMRVLNGIKPRRILCIPYYPDDAMTALAIKELFNIPLCTWVMDVQSDSGLGIPDALMTELLAKSALRLAISQELQCAYEQKYGLPLHFLPPVVPDALLSTVAQAPTVDAATGVIIGNIWSEKWLELLRSTVRGTGTRVVWYWTGGSWHHRSQIDRAALELDGILLRTPIEKEAGLVEDLRTRPFAVVPSGTLDALDDNPAISRLSLPSRIAFILATSNTPLIVLGSEETAAARFVRRHKIGTVSAYDPASFRAAVEQVSRPAAQKSLRENAARLAPALAAAGTAEWIWQSLAAGGPFNERFAGFVAPLT